MNFVVYWFVGARIGGDALNGYERDGRHFLASHGRYTEVEASVFEYSRWHTYSLFITHPGCFFFGVLSHRYRRRMRKEARRASIPEHTPSLPRVHVRTGPAVMVVQMGNPALEVALREKGYEIVELTHDDLRLLDRTAEAGPSVILVEVESSGTTGFAVCTRVKSDVRLRVVPTVLFSSEADEGTFEQHRKLRTRADAYVATSEPKEIVRAINDVVGPDVRRDRS